MSALALALLLCSAGALPTPELAVPGGQVTVRAELGEVAVAENLVRAEGGVVLESGGLLLRADLLEYDLASREANANGQVIFVDGNIVALADEGWFSLQGDRPLSLRGATLFNKGSVQQPATYLTLDAAGARAQGENALTLQAEEIERIALSRFVARRIELSSCDTGEGRCAPWSLGASSADIVLGERAVLKWPTFRVLGVPLLVLPALYVPLSDRRTGLLIPQLRFQARTIIAEQPFFLTLGRSWDVTLAAGYGWRISSAPVTSPRPPEGPRASAELRYAPAQSTSGRLFVAGVDDHLPVQEGGEPFGLRGQLAWRHATELSNGLGLQADARAMSDARYLDDESPDFLKTQVPYLRSEGRAGWRTEPAVVSVSSSWYQTRDAAILNRFPTNPEWRLFGDDSPMSFQRPVAARLDVPSLRLFGPVRGGLEIAAGRYQPIAFGGPVDEKRLISSFSLAPQVTGEADLPRLPLSLSRLDVRPSLSLSLLGSGPVRAEAYAAARADLSSYAPSFGAGPSDSGLWGRAVAGIWAGTELSRSYGEGTSALRHTIVPRLELRGSTRQLGDRPVFESDWEPAVDEYDFANRTTTPRLLQGIASVRTLLLRRGGELARLELGQGYDLAANELGETFGELGVGQRFVAGSALARFDPLLGRFSQVGARLRLADVRGDELNAGYDWWLATGTSLTRSGLDDLFGPAAEGSTALYQQVALDAKLVIVSGALLRYGVTVRPGLDRPVLQHRFGLGLGGAKDCWHVEVTGEVHPSDPSAPGWTFGTFGVTVDLKNLGSFGS